MPTIKYFLLIIKHKWFVFIAGLKIAAPIWRLLTHDLSKFSFKELPHYGRQFFGAADQPNKFITAWLHHQNFNDHHWEWWIPRNKHNSPCENNKPVMMSDGAIREMVADWLGASRAYNNQWPDADNWEWFKNNFNDLKLHPDTRFKIILLLEVYFKNRDYYLL